jgi:DNA-binding response OmpR family regulator
MNEERKFKVLVVDDEDDIIGLLTLHLKMKHYEVVAATDGVKGLDVANKEHPDIILLDVMMPGIDGFEVCKRLKEKPATAEIPIIFLTARNQTDDRVKGLMSGADDYMVKPFDFDELELRIRRSLKKINPNKSEADIEILDLATAREKMVHWFNDKTSFDLFSIELVYDPQKVIPSEVVKDFSLSLMLAIREKKPSATLICKASPSKLFLFINTNDLESFAKLLIDNFKKNSLQNAHLKIKIRPGLQKNFRSSDELFDKLLSG